MVIRLLSGGFQQRPSPASMHQLRGLGSLVLSFLVAWAMPGSLTFAIDSRTIFDRVKNSVVTVELRAQPGGARRAYGSGYFISAHGDLLTNYHVVSDYLHHPDRYRLQVLLADTPRDARVVHFDLVQDLALLRVANVSSKPLPFARVDVMEKGISLYSVGNPEALGMSIVAGIYNGPKPNELVPAMNVTAPVNSGMSGGPILNDKGEVVGMNVSGLVDAELLKFGIPLSSIQDFLKRSGLAKGLQGLQQADYGDEITRQIKQGENLFAEAFFKPSDESKVDTQRSRLGPFKLPAVPDFIECGLSRNEPDQYNFEIKTVRCTYQGLYVDDKHPLNRVNLVFKYLSSNGGAIPFFSHLMRAADVDTTIRPTPKIENEYFDESCVSDRVFAGEISWLMNACTNRSRSYPGVFRYIHSAASVDRHHSALVIALQWYGMSSELRRRLVQYLFENVQRVEP